MAICDVVTLVLAVAGITGIVMNAFYSRTLRNLRNRYHTLRLLLLEQAELREMSFEAYIAMLREAQRHTDGQQF